MPFENLSNNARKRLISLHGWAATVLSIILYVVMLTGAIIVFDHEIYKWSSGRAESINPVLHHRLSDHIARFAKQVPEPLRQQISVGRGHEDTLRLNFSGLVKNTRGPRTGRDETYVRIFEVDPDSGRVQRAFGGRLAGLDTMARGRALEHFVVDLHVRLHVPGRWGLYLTGIAGVAMLVLAITGVMIHRHLFKEFFVTERPGKRLVSFRDKHNLAGVWSLPFAVLLAFTRAFLSFATSLGLPVVAMVAFGGDQQKAIDTVLGGRPAQTLAVSEPVDIDWVIARARARIGTPVLGVEIRNMGRPNSEIITRHERPARTMRGVVHRWNGVHGGYLGPVQTVGTAPSTGNTLAELVAPLHFGNFAGYWSRMVWVALGAAMTFTIVSGLQLWLRRRADAPGWAVAERAFSTVVWGLPIALVGSACGYFLARLGNAHEAGTVWGFLLTSAAVIGIALWWRRLPLDELARRFCLILGATMLFMPVLRLQTGGLSWGEAIVQKAVALMFIETLCLIIGALLTWISRRGTAREVSPSRVETAAE